MRRSTAHHTLRLLCLALLCGCSGGGSPPVMRAPTGYPPGISTHALTTIDETSGGPCAISTDGFLWYALPAGSIPPVDFTDANCSARATLDPNAYPQLPAWSHPVGATQAIFVATSLQEAYSLQGMQAIEHDAESTGVPVTWMIGNEEYLANDAAYYNAIHASNGDDVELERNSNLYAYAEHVLPWYGPAVSVEGAGHERSIPGAIALGNGGFWGITWNSHGTDNTSDEGAPWGTYCADTTSYKRPSPTGDCSMVSFEWTARDLTRAYLTSTNASGYSAEAAFSSDPDDVLQRAHFDDADAVAYERALVDAYAAAGVSQPIVMMSQQESLDESMYQAGDDPILTAIYAEAVSSGMKAMTLRNALAAAKTFSARPRAIAFPFIAGGLTTVYNGVPFSPATIDFHDDVAGMTFISGHTLPSRLYEYAEDPVSTFNHTLIETLPSNPGYPQLLGVTAAGGMLSFTFQAPVAIHFGVALWTDPAKLALSGTNVVPAGRAGAVVTFDLPAGRSTQTIPCGCTSTTFPFSS